MLAGQPEEIAAFIACFAEPPAGQVAAFVAGGRRAAVARGDALVALGDTTHPLYFVHSGIIRYMLILPDTGDDVTKDFSFGPTFAASFGSAVSGQPARVGIVAVTDCVVTRWPFARLTALYDADAAWQKLGRRLAEWLYLRKEDREIAFLTQTAVARYGDLTRTFGDRIDQVPQRHLASYLGITPESLSRLRARLAGRGAS